MNQLEDNPPKNSQNNEQENGKPKKKKKAVMWDWKSLEEQELEKKMNPKKKIDEPKTPYIPYEEGDDEYLKKLDEVNKVQPSRDIIDTVVQRLSSDQSTEHRRGSQNSESSEGIISDEEFIEVEVIDGEGKVVKEKRKKLTSEEEVEKNKEFQKKRKACYKNEFVMARKFFTENAGAEEDTMDETMKNTLYNKFAGKIDQTSSSKENNDS